MTFALVQPDLATVEAIALAEVEKPSAEIGEVRERVVEPAGVSAVDGHGVLQTNIVFAKMNLSSMVAYRKAYIDRKFMFLAAEVATAYPAVMITPAQIRAARAMIGWTQSALAEASGVAVISIKNIERGATDPRSKTLAAIQDALRKAGVVFLEPGDTRQGGAGVRLVD